MTEEASWPLRLAAACVVAKSGDDSTIKLGEG